MKFDRRYARVIILAIALLTMSPTLPSAEAAERHPVSHGVTVRILDETFSGDNTSLSDAAPETLSPGQPSKQVSGYPVLESETALAAFGSAGRLTYWTRRNDRLTRQGDVLLGSASKTPQFRLTANREHELALEVLFTSERHPHVVALSKDGILQITQPPGHTVTVRSPLRYALVPSLVGTDLLFDPKLLSANRPNHLPSLNMVVGLQEGNDGMLVAVWPPGKQKISVRVAEGDQPRVESVSLDTAGKSLFIRYIDHPDIWHAERLREEYLETDTAIDWQRPFEARWIGRFFIDSDGYDFPFYFLSERHKLWGRCIRGWHYYPVWFDGRKTIVHFEKKFPPIGELLVYYLDTYGDDKRLSPVGVMQKSLGKDVAARLLDFEGTREQVLLEHRNAVCAMCDKIVSHYAQNTGAPSCATVKQYSSDVATFIRLIRERVFQFDEFAAHIEELLDAKQQEHPALSEDLDPSRELLAEIRDIVELDLPETSLEEVGQWTGSITKLSPTDKTSVVAVKALTHQCRQVAGTQDDMARNLSIATIRLMEEAAQMGTASALHARLAEQIIVRCRSILRQPTWWEPCRKSLPKANPGAP
jgi:hypothetical protein